VVTDKRINLRVAEAVARNPEAAGSKPIDPKTGKEHLKYKSSVLASIDVLKLAPVVIYVENLSPFVGGRAGLLHGKEVHKVIHGYEFEYLGLGAAIENILVAAHGLGLGAIFMGDFIIKEDFIRRTVGFTHDFVGVIALGYSNQTKLWDKRLKPGRVVWH
jgi:nitroreductase